ncbi:MAG: WGR domain-containing protein [Paracoccus sp. (in: a-proteobacteria)]
MDSSPNPIHLTRRDPARNMARFYRIELTGDLFGGVRLVRAWGRLGTGGRQASEWFPGPDEAQASRALWLRRKLGRGYREG